MIRLLLLSIALSLTCFGQVSVVVSSRTNATLVGTFTNLFSANSNKVWAVVGNNIQVPDFDPQVLLVSEPVRYQFFQRTNNTGTISITATATGPTGTELEAQFNSGTWQTFGSTDYTGTATGTITGSTGQGSLLVRVVGDTNVATVLNVSIGDIFAVWGQSNGGGRGTSNQSFTNTSTLATLFGNDYTWQTLTDPTDSNTNQVDSISSDYDAGGMGSVWPLVADRIINSTGVPVSFVPCTKGGTGFGGAPETHPTSWTPGTDYYDRTTLFGSAMNRIREVGGVRAVLWWQGEGGFDDTTGASLTTPFGVMASAAVSEFPGLKFVPCKLQECPGVADNKQTNHWYGMGLLWANNTNVLRGPTLADVPIGDSGNIVAEDESGSNPDYHLKSTPVLIEAARRWATNLVANFP